MTENICNDFVTKLKAHGSNKDFSDLAAAHEEYHTVLIKLSSKEKSSFSLNVLCIICRNLEKVPSWRCCIGNTDLLKLCIDCVRHTRGVTGEPQVKTLAAIYHVHKYIVRQNVSSIPPELILKLSIMPFELDTPHLLKEYHKTYWSILADRINYIEKLKPMKIAIVKLIPKLNEDLSKVIQIYTDQYDFCTNILPFIVKKLTVIYADVSLSHLIKMYKSIFDNIKSFDLSGLNNASLDEVYAKFSECIYVITENLSKADFKDSPLDEIVRICLSLLGHRPDIFHCLQTFYLNSFMYIFNRPNDAANVFRNILVSCETTEKLGYKSIMLLTYPYLNQLLRLCIEYYQLKKVELEENCLNFILFLMEKVKYCKQLIKCENCKISSGFHDALRLSFLVKNIVNFNTKDTILYAIIEEQFEILKALKSLNCVNHEKYYAKLVSDTHNTAIQFYKSQKYDYAIHLFDFCIKNEFESQNKNLCRALYNKSICEVDQKLYENALKDGYLSMIFDNGQNLEKYMSLVLDIKGKAANDAESNEDIQLMSVVDACNQLSGYENLMPLLKKVKFSELLKQEFSIYVKLWPSLVPITGVIRAINNMIMDKYEWILSEDKVMLRNILYDVILKAPDVVRTIQEAHFKETLRNILSCMEYDNLPLDEKIVYISLLMMKSEHDLQDASDKYGWKQTEHTFDPSKSTIYKSIVDEYNASKDSIRAVELLTTLKRDIKNASPNRLPPLLRLCEMTIYQLLHLERVTHALQLAHLGLRLANLVSDKTSFVRCAGTLIAGGERERADVYAIAANALGVCARLLRDRQTADAALVFLCELGMYYARCKKLSIAAQLLRKAEKCVVDLLQMYSDVHLELAIGKILELGVMLSDVSLLSALNLIQRHYLTAQPTETAWLPRRRQQLQTRCALQQASQRCAKLCSRLKLWRRGRSAVGAALPPSAAAAHARLFASLCDAARPPDATVQIENRLKYVIGLTREITPRNEAKKTPPQSFRYENIEVSLNRSAADRSPTGAYTAVAGFRMPAFLATPLHTPCTCYACSVPACAVLACLTASLEASVYFRSKETLIARNYFEGAARTFELARAKLEAIDNPIFEEYIADMVKTRYVDELTAIEADFLIEYAFFELSRGDFDGANRVMTQIHGLAPKLDAYVRNEVSNLVIAAHELSKPRRVQVQNLVVELDCLRLTEPKTPESKAMPRAETPKVVRPEEVPKRLKPINKLLNFDEKETPQKPKPRFKVPELKIARPHIETITPRPSRSRKVEESPQEFFTPKSPEEKFFTPLPKTYLRPKDLEFLTPSEPKRTLRKKALLRATSPGKLEKEIVTRSRRVKQPNFDD